MHFIEIDLDKVMQAVQDGSEELLYTTFEPGLRWLAVRRGARSDDVDDIVQEALLVTIVAIRQNALKSPAAVLGYLRTIVIRRTVGTFRRNDPSQNVSINDLNPVSLSADSERNLLRKERIQTTVSAMNELQPKEREILLRFYSHEQSEQQICEEMTLTRTQFRLLKWRSKARLTSAVAGMLSIR